MTFAEIRGGVIVRLAPRDKIPVAGVEIEIHNAIDDILAQARMLGNDRFDVVEYADIVADLDIYPYPELADELREVWYLGFGKTPIPMTRVESTEAPIADWVGLAGSIMPFSYVDMSPDRQIRLLNKPSTSSADTLKFKYLPRGPRKMVKPDDEPSIPARAHECIIPLACMRMAGYEGISLAHPASFDVYRRKMEERLSYVLQPARADGDAHVIDNDPYYPGGA